MHCDMSGDVCTDVTGVGWPWNNTAPCSFCERFISLPHPPHLHLHPHQFQSVIMVCVHPIRICTMLGKKYLHLYQQAMWNESLGNFKTLRGCSQIPLIPDYSDGAWPAGFVSSVFGGVVLSILCLCYLRLARHTVKLTVREKPTTYTCFYLHAGSWGSHRTASRWRCSSNVQQDGCDPWGCRTTRGHQQGQR